MSELSEEKQLKQPPKIIIYDEYHEEIVNEDVTYPGGSDNNNDNNADHVKQQAEKHLEKHNNGKTIEQEFISHNYIQRCDNLGEIASYVFYTKVKAVSDEEHVCNGEVCFRVWVIVEVDGGQALEEDICISKSDEGVVAAITQKCAKYLLTAYNDMGGAYFLSDKMTIEVNEATKEITHKYFAENRGAIDFYSVISELNINHLTYWDNSHGFGSITGCEAKEGLEIDYEEDLGGDCKEDLRSDCEEDLGSDCKEDL